MEGAEAQGLNGGEGPSAADAAMTPYAARRAMKGLTTRSAILSPIEPPPLPVIQARIFDTWSHDDPICLQADHH